MAGAMGGRGGGVILLSGRGGFRCGRGGDFSARRSFLALSVISSTITLGRSYVRNPLLLRPAPAETRAAVFAQKLERVNAERAGLGHLAMIRCPEAGAHNACQHWRGNVDLPSVSSAGSVC